MSEVRDSDYAHAAQGSWQALRRSPPYPLNRPRCATSKRVSLHDAPNMHERGMHSELIAKNGSPLLRHLVDSNRHLGFSLRIHGRRARVTKQRVPHPCPKARPSIPFTVQSYAYAPAACGLLRRPLSQRRVRKTSLDLKQAAVIESAEESLLSKTLCVRRPSHYSRVCPYCALEGMRAQRLRFDGNLCGGSIFSITPVMPPRNSWGL